MITPAPGRPTDLFNGAYQAILKAVPEIIIQEHIARAAGVHPRTLARWLSDGENDFNAEKDTIYAQFHQDYHKARTIIIRERLESIKEAKQNWQAHAWILEKTFREHFGKESEEMRELRVMLMQLLSTKGDQNGKA